MAAILARAIPEPTRPLCRRTHRPRRLLHGSAPNHSDHARTLFIAIYTAEDAIPLSPNPVPSRFEGLIVRGEKTNRVRSIAFEMELPQKPSGASFFVQQQAGTFDPQKSPIVVPTGDDDRAKVAERIVAAFRMPGGSSVGLPKFCAMGRVGGVEKDDHEVIADIKKEQNAVIRHLADGFRIASGRIWWRSDNRYYFRTKPRRRLCPRLLLLSGNTNTNSNTDPNADAHRNPHTDFNAHPNTRRAKRDPICRRSSYRRPGRAPPPA